MISINLDEKNEVVIIIIIGDITAGDMDDIEHYFKENINIKINVIALDLKNVMFLDSFGISKTIKLLKNFNEKGIDFILINLNDQIRQILKISTFDKIFKIMTVEDFTAKYIYKSS
jgi:anti-sigma B factor antagonist